MSTPFPAVDPSFNFLGLEDELIEHLKAEVPELKAVDTVTSIDAVEASNLPTPAVSVAFSGFMVDDEAPAGAPQRFEQYWALVVMSREKNDKSGRRSREAIGPTTTLVLRAARSFKVPEGFEEFKLIGQSRPNYKDGLLYIPLVFKTSFVL